MVVTVVSKRFIPWDGPRLEVIGGLLPVGSAKPLAAVDIGSERGMDCYDLF